MFQGLFLFLDTDQNISRLSVIGEMGAVSARIHIVDISRFIAIQN
ncbi:hypothetical protein SAMN05660420_00880 [Desulfuromusa kysingii]|uniref:Uncharacterized protein n=1 Tax=Desulfuromusa kysingii TaxID=37625 RepID=A0A1H3X9I4_9BACT|nr:hypothetical protein SAMN05660420_00880 [Desulfuromusa kysingii]